MKNIILTGFMGTGKTTVGNQVAEQLQRSFVDMDAAIETRAGKPISRIFSEDGEAAFREMETNLCAELSGQKGLVIATGGGTLVDAPNRERMMRSGTVICLGCEPTSILRRLSAAQRAARPLLSVPDPLSRLEKLLEARREAYAAIRWHIDTTNLRPREVVARVIDAAQTITLTVRFPTGQYDIHIGEGLLAHLGEIMRGAGIPEGGLVAVVTNPVVEELYSRAVKAALRSAGYQPLGCSVPDGEQYKTLDTVAGLYEQFTAGDVDRTDTVMALGGGVTTDLAGYAAATFMRGIRLVHVPTTLLAMVDATTGGKTGVDLPQGKNLVGAFKQPALVVADPTVLDTLPSREVRAGMAETIKHAIVGAPELFGQLEGAAQASPAQQPPIGAGWIARSLRVKAKIVEEDPFERGRRSVLNLGHTLGHALEALSAFRLRHGEAVSIGITAAGRIAVARGLADDSLVHRIETVFTGWGLPVQCPGYEIESIWAAMKRDKKRQARRLRWVLPRAVGDVGIFDDVTPDQVRSVLRAMGAGEGG